MVPTLTTERLILRPRGLEDLDAAVAMDSDVEVRRFITPAFRDDFDAAAYRVALAERMAIDAGPGLGWWTLRLRGDRSPGQSVGRYLGMALLIPVALAGPDVEIGWRLPRAAWGTGYASEAARAIVQHAFGTLGLPAIIALIDPANARSLAVAARLGFTADGRQAAHGHEFGRHVLRRHL